MSVKHVSALTCGLMWCDIGFWHWKAIVKEVTSLTSVVSYWNKHNCVLSNAGLSNALTKTGICTSLKSGFYFRFQSPLNTKSACRILSAHGILCGSVEKCGHQSPKTAKIGIRTSLKSATYFGLSHKQQASRRHISEPHAKFGQNW